MFTRAKTPSLLPTRSSTARPLSEATEATEIFDTDFEDESESEDFSGKRSFESVSLVLQCVAYLAASNNHDRMTVAVVVKRRSLHTMKRPRLDPHKVPKVSDTSRSSSNQLKVQEDRISSDRLKPRRNSLYKCHLYCRNTKRQGRRLASRSRHLHRLLSHAEWSPSSRPH